MAEETQIKLVSTEAYRNPPSQKNKKLNYRFKTEQGNSFSAFNVEDVNYLDLACGGNAKNLVGLTIQCTKYQSGEYWNIKNLKVLDPIPKFDSDFKPETMVTERDKQDGQRQGNARTVLATLLTSEHAPFAGDERRHLMLGIMPKLVSDAGFPDAWNTEAETEEVPFD